MAYFFLWTKVPADGGGASANAKGRNARISPAPRVLLERINLTASAGDVDHPFGDHRGSLNGACEPGAPDYFSRAGVERHRSPRLDVNHALAENRGRGNH